MLIAAGMVTCLIDHEDMIIATRIIGVAASRSQGSER
jgi:hypothetical protein